MGPALDSRLRVCVCVHPEIRVRMYTCSWGDAHTRAGGRVLGGINNSQRGEKCRMLSACKDGEAWDQFSAWCLSHMPNSHIERVCILHDEEILLRGARWQCCSDLWPPQALLGGGHRMDLAGFQSTLWDTLTKGDTVKVRAPSFL